MAVQLPPGVDPRSPAPAAVQNNGGWQTPVPQAGGGVELNAGERVLAPRPMTPAGNLPQWPAMAPQPQQQYHAPQYQPQQPQQAAPAYQQPAYQYPQFAAPAQPQYQQPVHPGQYAQPGQYYQQPTQPGGISAGIPAGQQVQPYGQIIAQQVAATQSPPQPSIATFTLPPDPNYAQPRHPFQFNDGLQLGGQTGGGNTAGGLGGLPMQPAPAVFGAPQGASVQAQPGAAYNPQYQGPVASGQMPVASTALRDALVASGVQVAHYPSDEAVLADFGQSAEQLNHLRQMARLGYQYLEAQRGGQSSVASGPLPQQPQPTTDNGPRTTITPPAKPARPEWKSEWDGLVRRDSATGRFTAIDPNAVNPLIVERANEVEAWRRERAAKIVNDPLALLKEEGLDALLAEQFKAAKEELRQEMLAEQQARAGQQRVQEFLSANQSAFYVLDQTGRQLTNNVTGQPLLTALGQHAFTLGNQYAQQFEQQYGVTPDPASVIDYVQLRLRADGYQGPGQSSVVSGPLGQPRTTDHGQLTASRPTADQLKEQVLAQALARQQQIAMAGHAPNTGGTIAAAAQTATLPQNPRLSFRDMLVQGAIQQGRLRPDFSF